MDWGVGHYERIASQLLPAARVVVDCADSGRGEHVVNVGCGPDGAAGTTTIESKTNFLRAVRSGHVEAVSRPLHAGHSVVVVETDVIDAEGRLVARVTQSQIVLRA